MNKILSILLFSLIITSNLFAERVIIFNDEYNKAVKSSAISKADHKVIRHSKGGFVVAEIDETKLKKSNIKYILDRKIFRKAALPNDPGISSQWSISNTKLSNLWDSKGYNCGNIVVAVVDTGIDYTHEDLSANILINSSEIPGNSIDDDGNGFKDDYYGYDFAYNDNDPRDGDGHGSHVAGIIGAVINNSKGIAGVCNVKLLTVKVLDDKGNGKFSDVYEGIIYAADRGAKIINLSMETETLTYSEKILFDRVIDYAQRKGSIIVVAAGNDNVDLSSQTVLASLRNSHDNMFVVGSHNSSNNFSSFSSYGGLLMDIVAPGESIYSTFKDNGYYTYSGTSMATPFVSGVVAHLLANEPNLSFQDVRNRLYNATVKNSSFLGKALCDGRLDLSKLFSPIDRPIITKIDNTNPAYQQTVTLTGYFKDIDYLYWNNRSVPFTKLDDNRITFKVPFLEVGETYGVLKAVYNGQESNSIVIRPTSVITTTSSVSINLSDGTLSILETGSYPVSGYSTVGEGVKFYLSSSSSYVRLTITKNQIISSDTNVTYGALVDENGNQRVVSSESGVYVYDNVSTNKTYFFVEVTAGSSGGGGGCFIATAVFGSYMDPHVKVLRDFRDKYLLTNSIGKWFVEKYYKYSPPIADFIRDKEILKFLVRMILLPIVFVIQHFYLSMMLVFVGFVIIYRNIKGVRFKNF